MGLSADGGDVAETLRTELAALKESLSQWKAVGAIAVKRVSADTELF